MKKYRIVVMSSDGKTFLGRTYDSWEEMHNAMIGLRVLYAESEVTHYVGYMEM